MIRCFLLLLAGLADAGAAPSAPAGDLPVQGTTLSGPEFRMVMPAVSQVYQGPAELPWGKATEIEYQAGDAAKDTLVLFATYAWQRAGTKIDKAGLAKVRTFMLRNHGCGADDVRGMRLQDGKGKIWPQTIFQGECESGESFIAAYLVVNGSLYQFQAAHQATIHRHARQPLAEALAKLVRGFSFE
jgi:hypothetical protein